MFTNFKKVLGEQTKQTTEDTARRCTPLKNILLSVAPIAEKKAFTKEVITASF
jgi:hypothetical protein